MDLIKPLFSLSYWFGVRILPFAPAISLTIQILMSALVLAGIALWVYVKLQKGIEKTLRRVLKRVATLCLTMGIVGWLFYGFYYEGIPVLSMRFWYVIWFAIVCWWTYDIVIEYRKKKALQLAGLERAKFEKWLPKPKH